MPSRAEHLQLDLVGAVRRLDLDAFDERLRRRLAPLLDALDVAAVVEFRRVLEVGVRADLGLGIGGLRIGRKEIGVEQLRGIDVNGSGIARGVLRAGNVKPGAHPPGERRVDP